MSVIKKNRSLIMCVTPLQMLIAERIIELKSDESFDLLVVALNDNEKYRTYFERVKKHCVNSLYYVQGKRRLFFFIKQLKKNRLDIKYNNYYLASIDSIYFQYIISKNKHSDVFTFDDGTANIMPSSLYYSNTKPKFLQRAVWRVLGVKHYMAHLKEKSLLHYTIYKDISNIIDNQQYLSLIPLGDEKQSALKDKTIGFYLGQPLTDISENFDLSFVKNNIDKLKVDYYYPHPREKVYPEGNYQIVESPLIFEDYIVQFLKDNPNVSIEVYSFTSTALINIMSLDRIQVTYIHDNQFFKLYKSFYEFSEELFGILHLDLDSVEIRI